MDNNKQYTDQIKSKQ